MGLFNFIYKLTNILSNKKKMRIFFIIAIVIILLFCWTRGSFAVTPEEGISLSYYQILMQESCIQYLRDLYTQKPIGFDIDAFNSVLSRMRYSYFYVEVSSDTYTIYKIIFYNPNNANNRPTNFTVDGTYSLGLNSGTQYECKLGLITPLSFSEVKMHGNSNRSTPTYSTNVTDLYMPSDFYCIRSTYVTDFLAEFGYYDTLKSTYNTNDEELQALTQAGFQQQVTAINNAKSSIDDVNSSVEDVNQSVNEMIDTIVDPYINVTAQQLPENNVQDPTTDGLNSLFIMIKDAFTGTPESVSFPVPFTDQSFTIEPGFTENSMRKGGLGTMVSVIHLYWYYRIYGFIFLRYVDLLEKLKEGEFEETVGNIKKEVL